MHNTTLMPELPDNLRATVLIVDDDTQSLGVLGNLLHSYYDVLAAPSGARALQIAVNQPKPDLILLDVLMPNMDGYDVLLQLRDNPATRDIPVIFVTGLDSTEDEERGLELGAVDYKQEFLLKYYPSSLSHFLQPTLLVRVRD